MASKKRLLTSISIPTFGSPLLSLSLPSAFGKSNDRRSRHNGGNVPDTEPPTGALIDIDGYLIVDKYGHYIVPQD